jgi:FAD/FMN-containing dehydrogenase
MSNLIERTLSRLGTGLDGRLSAWGDERYAQATAIWPKSVNRPRAIVHCCSAEDVQLAIQAAGDSHLPLSVRGGGHDWAGRSLCDGIVLDLSGMRDVVIGLTQSRRSAVVLALWMSPLRPIREASLP